MTIDTTTMTDADKKALFAQLKSELEPVLTTRDPEVLAITTSIRELATAKKVKVSDVVAVVLNTMRKKSILTPALAEQLDANPEPEAPSKKK